MNDVIVRDAVLADVERLDALLKAAYITRRSFAAGLRAAIQDGTARTFVVELDGEAVGIASLHDYGVCGYVAQVGVDPAYRRRGLGRRMTSALIDAADARGYEWLELDATAMAAPLYRELGFVDFGDTIVYEGPTYGAPVPTVERAGEADLIEICDYDWTAFGADRKAIVRALCEDPDIEIFVVREDGLIVGYSAAREERIAPWIASNAENAMRLLDATRFALAPRTALVYVPSDNAAARAALEVRGFIESARLAHMVRGRRGVARRDWIYGRVSLGEG